MKKKKEINRLIQELADSKVSSVQAWRTVDELQQEVNRTKERDREINEFLSDLRKRLVEFDPNLRNPNFIPTDNAAALAEQLLNGNAMIVEFQIEMNAPWYREEDIKGVYTVHFKERF